MLLSWILLNFIAFFQLPNPRGYKIFNWLCLALYIIPFSIGLTLGIIAESNTIMETIGILSMFLGIIAISVQILITSIRVILYKIPNITQL